MTAVINQLRGYCEAGTADYTVAGTAYWSDDQLQMALDYNRVDVRHAPMAAIPAIGTANATTWTEYQIGWRDLESDPVIQDGDGNTVGTAGYTFNSQLGIATFTSDQGGSIRYLTGHSFNVPAAAAYVWNSKAAHYAVAVDVSTDNMSVKRSQLIDHCKQMAQVYGQAANGGSVFMERSDV
jgi:hypothetical protein